MADLIKRPDEFYVGFKAQGVNEPHLAFLTPFDTTAAFKKRKDTVDNWADTYIVVNGRYTKDTGIPAINVRNEPLLGFKISESVKRTGGWNSGNVVWRIYDPRGFEWEIPSANLAQIITQTGISAGGVINGRCLIGRLGANNILIPEGTDLWDQMLTDMETRHKKAIAKVITDLHPGDAITLKDGSEGFYLGKRKMMLTVPDDLEAFKEHGSSSYTYYRKLGFHEEESKHEYHMVVSNLSDYNYKEGYYPVSVSKGNPPVVAVDPQKSITAAAVDKMLNAPKCYPSFAGKAPEDGQDIKRII